jgi:diguanylate cyclase (GGDEF)-like protein
MPMSGKPLPHRGGKSLIARAVGPVKQQPSLGDPSTAAARELRFFVDSAQLLTSFREPKTLLRSILNKITARMQGEAWCLYLRSPSSQELMAEMTGGPKARRLKRLQSGSAPGPVAWVATHGRPLLIPDTRQDRRFLKDFKQTSGLSVRSTLCLPILRHRQTLAVLEIVNKTGGRFDDRDVTLLTQLLPLAAIALDRVFLVREIVNLSITDELTQLFNQRHLDAVLESEIRRSHRYGSKLSLIFLDLDNFKEINTHHTHSIGSRCLKELALIMKKNVRGVDVLARYGGDEFVVILPETTVETACMVAERVRQSIRTHVFLKELGINKRLTASIGIAGFPEHAKSKQDLIRKADEAMYRAKAAGRDRLAVAES